jgi:hypothetical protein
MNYSKGLTSATEPLDLGVLGRSGSVELRLISRLGSVTVLARGRVARSDRLGRVGERRKVAILARGKVACLGGLGGHAYGDRIKSRWVRIRACMQRRPRANYI